MGAVSENLQFKQMRTQLNGALQLLQPRYFEPS